MPNNIRKAPPIKREPVSPTIKVEERDMVVQPPDASLEDGEITEDETIVAVAASPIEKSVLAEPTVVDSMTDDSLTLNPTSDLKLDLAKDIVLDLLGWGVTPEYLVEAGVSSAALYAIFTDLHLRLPSNLDMSLINPTTPGSTKVVAKTDERMPVVSPKLARSL